MKPYIVQQGECLISIAEDSGFFWESLWNLPDNAVLKTKRQDPFALYPGDVVTIPDPRPREESLAIDSRHIFRRKGSPAKLSIRIAENGKPRASEPYTLTIDDLPPRTGTTGADGSINEGIPPLATGAVLLVGQGEDAVEYDLDFGHIDPIDEMTGAQGRLKDLGYFTGEIDGQSGPELEMAIRRFQVQQGLNVSGHLDAATRAALQKEYGG
jgi:hypothetical protein